VYESMAKSLFRSFSNQITGGGSKTTDIQIVQAISRFEDERTKLGRFKREFDKYTQARVLFDNAENRFFEFIRSLNDSSTWSRQRALVQACENISSIRNEHSQQLNKQMTASISVVTNTFKAMQVRIDEQNRTQHDYDKTRRQYQSSIKHDEPRKVDSLKSDLDQLKAALALVNTELRGELPKFHHDLQNQYIEIIKDVFSLQGKYYKRTYKSYSSFTRNLRDDTSISTYTNGHDSRMEMRSPLADYDTRKLYSIPSSPPKRTDYKVLHRARVIHDYKAENDDELDLTKDEYISVISFHNDEDNIRDKGWEYAEKADGTVGLYPVNFAARLYYNEEKHDQDQKPNEY
jgi:hypothetical protein